MQESGYYACADHEETCKRRHRDHKTYCYASDLLLDEGHWIGRPEQAGRPSVVTKKMADFMDKR